MTQVTVNADITLSTQQLMSAVAQLETSELEAFFASVGELLKQRQQDAPAAPLSSLAQSLAQITNQPSTNQPSTSRTGAESDISILDIPIVEALIPRSITLDGSDVSL